MTLYLKSYLKPFIVVVLLLSSLCAATAEAGSQAKAEAQFEAEQIIAFAKKVEKTLAARGARVFILARQGRPSADLPDGFQYTHVAFGVYSMIKTADGRSIPGYAIYNLYQDDKKSAVSRLVMDYPADFYAGVYALKTAIVIPKPALQQRLLQVIASDTYRKLHNPAYSLLANPYNNKFQNCTEHTLDVINAAIYQSDDIKLIKANTQAYFEAQPVNINPFKLFIGALAMPDVRTSDHQGAMQTATFTTIARYLDKYDLIQERFVITQ